VAEERSLKERGATAFPLVLPFLEGCDVHPEAPNFSAAVAVRVFARSDRSGACPLKSARSLVQQWVPALSRVLPFFKG
jgi:hypothetical protein